MMAEYNMTDKEQVEMIKKWWKEYGRIIAIAIVIGLAVAFGWRYWQQQQRVQVQKAAALYGQLGLATSQGKTDSAKTMAAELMNDYKKTPYGSLAALWLARESVNTKHYDDAFSKCQWVIDHSKVNGFKQIARIRAARVLSFQKKYTAALALLKTVSDKGFEPLVQQTQGDIYTAMNKPRDAKKYYKEAQTGLKAQDISDPILNMKVAQQ